MGEEAVATWAVVVALWRLCGSANEPLENDILYISVHISSVCVLTQFRPLSAVNVEGLVALVHLADGLVKDEAVRAQLLCGHTVDALVVFVALHSVLVLIILGVRRALEARLGA